MSAINLRLPESLHEAAKSAARREQVSLNQLITLALAEKLSALMTEDYLLSRAEKGNLNKFQSALSKVSDTEPDEQDRL
jgi:hypothetical protein